MLFYTDNITSRVQFITDFIGREIGVPFQLTDDREAFKNHSGPGINYSHHRITENEFFLQPHPILFEKDINLQPINCFNAGGYIAFFKAGGDFPYDIFATSFYLLSRYEEYLPHEKDEYGRYSHQNSLAFKENFLHLPLVNIWMDDLKKYFQKKFPSLTLGHSPFRFIPTYDIDEAYSYKYKSPVRTIGGAIKQLATGKWNSFTRRLKALSGKCRDPFDSYDWMNELHQKNNLKPVYFFHVSAKNSKYDKNILPSHPVMKKLIAHHAEKFPIGIHPSWQSGDKEDLLQKEINELEKITGKKITLSRQHFIRFNLPVTFRKLIEVGICDDYSMGYGSINGFRASVASSFYWYDLEREQRTNLLLHPFCFMDANSFFEQKFTPQQAFTELKNYYEVIKSVNGTLITIWHNTFLGTEKLFAGWRDVYKDFIEKIIV